MSKLYTNKSISENSKLIIENTIRHVGGKLLNNSLDNIKLNPYYPSLRGISQILKEWKINNLAIKLRNDQLVEINFPAIAYLNDKGGRFVLLVSLVDEIITYHDTQVGIISEEINSFILRWDGITLLLDVGENVQDPNYTYNKKKIITETLRNVSTLFVILLLIYILFIQQPSIEQLTLFSLNSIGILLSVLIIELELGKSASTVCKLGEKVDCISVLNSRASTFFGLIKMSEIGIIWFISNLLIVLLSIYYPEDNSNLKILLITSVLSCSYIPFSLIYQGIVVKKWCTLCLGILVVILVNAIFLLLIQNNIYIIKLDFTNILKIFLCFIIPTICWIWIYPLIKGKILFNEIRVELNKFKYNEELFNILSSQQQKIFISISTSDICVGLRENFAIKITLVLNIFCEPCKQAFKDYVNLTQNSNNQILTVIRFIVKPDDDDLSKLVIKHILSIDKTLQIQAIDSWFALGNYNNWAKIYPVTINDSMEQAVSANYRWSQENSINKTPTLIINDYLLPDMYNSNDLVYLLSQNYN